MFLITTDLHLTDQQRDEYRFRFLTWLLEVANANRPDKLIILGDLTDAKDNHSAILVKRIVEAVEELAATAEVVIVKGNHDYLDPATPFFGWLGIHPRVRFIVNPTGLNFSGKRCLFLPHTNTRAGFQGEFKFDEWDYIFCHQTFDGARGDNGQKLTGINPAVFSKTEARVYSGDVHSPQRLGRIEYVGAPYPIHFGDEFEPRVILDDMKGNRKDVRVQTIRKCSVTTEDPDILADLNLHPGDQVKVTISLPRSDFSRWEMIRQRAVMVARRIGVDLASLELKERPRSRIVGKPIERNRLLVSSVEIYEQFCDSQNVEEPMVKAGRRYL